jgi:hypothetical protein
MSDTERRQAEKQRAKSAVKKPATVNVPPPRQVKRTAPITAPTQAAKPAPAAGKPPAPVERPKQQLAKQLPATALDGFTGFNDSVEGDERPQGGSVIQGTLLKFSSEAVWLTGNGEEMSRERELIAVDIARIVQKWIDQMPVETIIVPPGERFPDVQAMNEAAPKSEWREDLNGNMRGPYVMQYLLYLIDAHSLDRYTFATSTIGGGIACRELADKVAWMRKYRGPKVSAVITLADAFMKTKYGGRQRPHFQIVRWIGFDTGGGETLPARKPPLEGGAVAKPEAPPWNEVKEPSLQEELGDEIPDYGDAVPDLTK